MLDALLTYLELGHESENLMHDVDALLINRAESL